ncbi:hypothetical protein FZC78_03725 [Rossellomorea vietnamensis]|uniref:Uncharacterized protein n=1 Tax=Rossellomorea vietnamensis TaxID=218284 RepID=A0A5D4NXY2_9BACI|nr:hypothetical protein [Rossellomorea vietnamensis]TYS18641.1 hypothetical protein FZC78_03725 [Rossellomorea vietnamensis]
MKDRALRTAYIALNAFCYLMMIGVFIFVVLFADALGEIGRLSIWVITLLSLLFVSVLGSVQIVAWIKEGKL